MRLIALFALIIFLQGCGVAALPCKITRDILEAVPVVGDVAAVPFDACAKAID